MLRECLIIGVAICASSRLGFLDAREESGMGREPLVYGVARLAEPVEIDGNWNKPAWENIEPLVINQHMGEEPDHRPGVQAKLAYDDSSLYIIYRVEDRYVRAVARKYQGVIGQCEDLIPNIVKKKIQIRPRKIGSADASCKECIAADDELSSLFTRLQFNLSLKYKSEPSG